MAKLVSKTYGEALFSLATEENKVDELFEQVLFVKDVFEKNAELLKFLSHPKISKDEKLSVTEKIFKDYVSTDLLGFLNIIINKERQDDIISIFDYFISAVKELKKIGCATVTSAMPLTDAQKKQIEKKLLEGTAYESFETEYKVDKTLLGGMVIRIGDRVVDASIKQKLDSMARMLRDIQLG